MVVVENQQWQRDKFKAINYLTGKTATEFIGWEEMIFVQIVY